MKHFRIVDEHGNVIDEQSFRTVDEARAWAATHPRAASVSGLEERVDGEWNEPSDAEGT